MVPYKFALTLNCRGFLFLKTRCTIPARFLLSGAACSSYRLSHANTATAARARFFKCSSLNTPLDECRTPMSFVRQPVEALLGSTGFRTPSCARQLKPCWAPSPPTPSGSNPSRRHRSAQAPIPAIIRRSEFAPDKNPYLGPLSCRRATVRTSSCVVFFFLRQPLSGRWILKVRFGAVLWNSFRSCLRVAVGEW